LTNNGADAIRTSGLWMYQDGTASEFQIFTIEPRASIFFSARDVGGVSPTSGEIALFDGGTFSDADAMVDYVAWGGNGHETAAVAVDARLWGEDDTVETTAETVILVKVVTTSTGSIAWETSTEAP
jgi:hypothetical protein